MTDYNKKIAELQADVQTIWKLQCQNLYNSKNLGALAVRECIQNSVDAITKAVRKGTISKWDGLIQITYDEFSTVTITDNGCGMDIKTIHDKFLKLGGTTKGDEDNVGGFGLAKAVILGCGDWFSIDTQDNYLCSDDLGKKPITKTQSYRNGTQIVLKGVQTGKNTVVADNPETFKYSILEYVLSSEIPYRVTVNGTEYNPWFPKSRKTYRSPATFNISSDMIPCDTKLRIDVHKTENGSKYLFVRLRGLTQFKQYLGWNANCHVVVDFDTKLDPRSTEYPFSTNREGLKAQFQGILEAIRDKISQSPMSISASDDFKETLYENTSSDVAKERKISASFNQVSTRKLVEEVSKIVEGIQPQGGYTQPSVADRAKQYQQQIEDLAKQEGKTTEEFIRTMSYKSLRKLDNPLEYSWLIWQDKNYTGKKLNKNKAVDIIIIWDSILRIMASKYSGMNGKVFYPGVIVKENYLGMCVEKTVGWGEQRCYVMVNPFKIPTEDDTQTALYLMGVAAHELAHFVCGTYEAHGETFSYTREAIMNASLGCLNDVIQLVKSGKLRKKLVKTSKTSDNSGINFKDKTIEEIITIANDCGIDVEELSNKYTDKSIFRMRLIMAIKACS